jgi:hypothetical protein
MPARRREPLARAEPAERRNLLLAAAIAPLRELKANRSRLLAGVAEMSEWR